MACWGIPLLLFALGGAAAFPGYIDCDRDVSAGTIVMHAVVEQSQETVRLFLNNKGEYPRVRCAHRGSCR